MRPRLILAAAIVCFASGSFAAEPGAQEAGKTAFRTGVNLVNDPDGAKYDEALAEFKRAYGLLGNWKILGNIGLCALKVERDGEAIEAYEKYLRDGAKEIELSERDQIERDLVSLKSRLVHVRLVFPQNGGTLIDERVGSKLINEYPVGAATLDLGLHPGHHVLVWRSLSGEERWESSLAAGGNVTHTFSNGRNVLAMSASPAAPPRSSSQATIGLLVGGAGVVGLGVGTVLILGAKSTYDEWARRCDARGCDPEGFDATERARKSANVATVVFGAGAAAAAAGALLWLTAPKGVKTGTPAVGVSPSGIVVRGTL